MHPEVCAERLGCVSLQELMAAKPELLELIWRFEKGRIDKSGFLQHVDTILPHLTPADVEQAWYSMLGDEVPGIAALVNDMAAMGLRTVFFSDVTSVHYQFLRGKLSFLAHVSGAVVSYEIGERKPAAAMFEAMEQRFCDGGVPLLYVDDDMSNVTAARERGWNSYCFGTVNGIREALRCVSE